MSNAPSLETLNLEIRVLMVRRGKRQGDLSAVLGIGQSQVARRLAGEIEWKWSDLVAIAALLDVPLPELVALAIPAAEQKSA